MAITTKSSIKVKAKATSPRPGRKPLASLRAGLGVASNARDGRSLSRAPVTPRGRISPQSRVRRAAWAAASARSVAGEETRGITSPSGISRFAPPNSNGAGGCSLASFGGEGGGEEIPGLESIRRFMGREAVGVPGFMGCSGALTEMAVGLLAILFPILYHTRSLRETEIRAEAARLGRIHLPTRSDERRAGGLSSLTGGSNERSSRAGCSPVYPPGKATSCSRGRDAIDVWLV